MSSTKKKWLIYTGYILVVAGFFLYILFPSNAVKSYIRYRLATLAPGVDFNITGIEPGFPPQLIFSGVDFRYRNQPFINIDRVAFLPSYIPLLKRQMAFHFKGKACGGRMDGNTNIATDGKSKQMRMRLAFASIKLGNVPALKNIGPYTITGSAAGNIDYSGPPDGTGKGNAEIQITGCTVKLKQPIFGISEISFDVANAVLDLKNKRLDLKKVTVKGHDLSGDATGTIFLNNPIINSRVQLHGKITPHPSLLKNIGAFFPRQYLREGGIPFRLYGTIRHVYYSLQ